MKKKILSLSLIAMVGLGIVATPSCKKYPEGPGMSLKSKKGRLAGEWKETKEIDSDGEVMSPDTDYTMTFTKDGKLTFKIVDDTFGNISFEGAWKFDDKKENIIITFDGDVEQLKILELKNKELGLEDSDGYKTYYAKQ